MDTRNGAAHPLRSHLVFDFTKDDPEDVKPYVPRTMPQKTVHASHDVEHEHLSMAVPMSPHAHSRRPTAPPDLRPGSLQSPDAPSIHEEKTTRAPSPDAMSNMAASTTSRSSGKLTDFFSNEVFQIVLHNPTTSHQLKKFAQTRYCGENLEFLEQVRGPSAGRTSLPLTCGPRSSPSTDSSMRRPTRCRTFTTTSSRRIRWSS